VVVQRVVLDGLYPEIIDDCVMAITLSLRKEVNVHVRPRKTDRGVIVEAAYKHWPEVLPQHGPGRKHNRPIVLSDWQRSIVDRRPQAFLRGLIHSDGCRTINRFCEYCDHLGIRRTQSNPRNISVSHRPSVARLDEFVGPKR
jgi:hypothetical protein